MATFDWDALSASEGEFMQAVIAECTGTPWLQPLLDALQHAGGVTTANKAMLFELRFGHALLKAGVSAKYETAGEGASTIDFGVCHGGQAWRIELLRFSETEAVKAATVEEADAHGTVVSGRTLSTEADDKRQSTEGETLKAIQRICQKCEKDGKPHKFPPPDGTLNVLLVDVRTFLNGGDVHDRLHIALGASAVASQWRLSWEGKPVTGVFDAATAMKGAREARERLHFIGFVHERDFGPGAITGSIQLVANPNLLPSADDISAAVKCWPLGPVEVLA